MDGGTCEASAFLGYGYRTSGLCIALGNYHNMDRRRRRIAPEFVDLHDWQGLVDWFIALAIAHPAYSGGNHQLGAMLEGLYHKWVPVLAGTAGRVRLQPDV
jgi:endoglucanase